MFLFDENLPVKFVNSLADIFPGSKHVMSEGIAGKDDSEIWAFAKTNNLGIMTKDSDFQQLSILNGFPPKVVWLKFGNMSTAELEQAIRSRVETIKAFQADAEQALIVLGSK